MRALVVALALALAGAAAHAQPASDTSPTPVVIAPSAPAAPARAFDVPPDAIAWRAPAECGDAAELRRRIAGYLELEPPPGPIAAVEITRDDDGVFHARIAIGASERALDGKDCTQVVDAAALVIALAVQAAAPAPPTFVERPASVATPRRVSLRVRGALDAGTEPHGGGGLDAGVAITSGRLAVIASARWFPSRFAAIEGATSAGVDVGAAGGAAEACVLAAGVWACGGAEAALVTGDGRGLVDARTTRSLWSALTIGVAGEVALGARARLIGELGGYFATKRPRFVLDDGTVLYEPSLVGARLFAGIEVTLF